MKRHPAIGWVRADGLPAEADLQEMLKLRRRVEELEQAVDSQRRGPPPGTEELMQGEDRFKFKYSFDARDPETYESMNYDATTSVTWNRVFALVAPKLITEAAEAAVRSTIRAGLETEARAWLAKDKTVKGMDLREFKIGSEDVDTILVQLRALGLIEESKRKRSVHDKGAYWVLTPYGDNQMVVLRAMRKTPAAGTSAGSSQGSS